MPIPRHTAAALVALALFVACGDDAAAPADITSTTAASTTTTEAATTTTTLVEPTTTTEEGIPGQEGLHGEGIGDLEQVAQQLLISAAEIQTGQVALTDVGYAPSGQPGPCGATVDETNPPEVLVGTGAGTADGTATFIEELRIYPDIEAARAALAAWRTAFGCGRDAVPALGAVFDATADVGTDAFGVRSAAGDRTFVVAQVADTVVVIDAAVPADAAPGDYPDVVEVAAFAAGKILAALES